MIKRTILTGGLLAGLLAFPFALFALEEYVTTADLIKRSPYVAHVRVEGLRRVPGPLEMYNYRVVLLENIKGRLPATFDVRVLLGSGVLHASPRPAPPGREWILILGEKNKYGIYPLRSLTWGKIEIVKHLQTGDLYLGRLVNGFPDQENGKPMRLDEFTARVGQLFGRKQGSGK